MRVSVDLAEHSDQQRLVVWAAVARQASRGRLNTAFDDPRRVTLVGPHVMEYAADLHTFLAPADLA